MVSIKLFLKNYIENLSKSILNSEIKNIDLAASQIISTIKSINQELNVHTAILADLQGPKIRIGRLERPLKIKSGQ